MREAKCMREVHKQYYACALKRKRYNDAFPLEGAGRFSLQMWHGWRFDRQKRA